uniref:Uncharacterized protein n=1 Tax=Vespula pensylvanica TaxID=30213 RepID=A0A834PA54_VESPE|nr:hypothetical protein H0235_002601 [Vespula pensylvanica]
MVGDDLVASAANNYSCETYREIEKEKEPEIEWNVKIRNTKLTSVILSAVERQASLLQLPHSRECYTVR